MKRKLVLSLGLAGLCLWLAVRNTRFDELTAAFKDVRWSYALLIFALFVLTYAFRALRWQVIVSPIKRIPFEELYSINVVGFLAIVLFPLRLGELIRPLIFRQRHGIPMATGLVMVGVERVLDSLVGTGILVLGFAFAPIGNRQIPVLGVEVHTASYGLLGILLTVTAFLIFGAVAQLKAIAILTWATGILSEKLRMKLISMAENLFRGLHSLPNVRSLTLLLLYSCGVWLPVVLAYHLGLNAFGLRLHWSAPFIITGIAMVGVMLPGAPASVGTYQLFIQEGLALFGVSRSIGFAYSVVLQGVNLGFLLAVGLPLLPKMSTRMGALYREAAQRARENESV